MGLMVNLHIAMNFAPGRFAFPAFLMALLFPLSAFCQTVTGIWRGYFVTDDGEQYKYELQLKQSSSNRVSGVSYSYLDTRFYGKATLTGMYLKQNKSALVQEIKTVELRMASGNSPCIMKCQFTLSRSGKEWFLEGAYSSKIEKGQGKGNNCGGGKVFLRKVTTSDFYVEPFLRTAPPPVRKDTAKVVIPKQKPTASVP